MPLSKRIIPCLDVDNGRVVKGIRFRGVKDAGDPVELARKYSDQGADELVFLDITASKQDREIMKSIVKKVAYVIDIPFTVGGGIRTLSLQWEEELGHFRMQDRFSLMEQTKFLSILLVLKIQNW